MKLVDFNFLKDISIDSLGFDVYNPNGKIWEDFQSKWKQITGFFIPNSPKIKGEESLKKLNDSEQIPGEVEQIEELLLPNPSHHGTSH
ncbi:hypothetical protein J1N35_037454 [Gossypium stocksii]|uniref:Uncharacterized protein n=1 Tax=Gossypium stocksii TaxID=47602 RepID=A0A9D3ZLW3_9ROSI|nr:hypothetical protein J1N35_037454 [Gossypium stocksii]